VPRSSARPPIGRRKAIEKAEHTGGRTGSSAFTRAPSSIRHSSCLSPFNVTGYDLSDIDRFTSRAPARAVSAGVGSLYLDMLVEPPVHDEPTGPRAFGSALPVRRDHRADSRNRDSAITLRPSTPSSTCCSPPPSRYHRGSDERGIRLFFLAIVAVSCREGLRATLAT